MANLTGATPYAIERFTSLVEQDDPTNLPLGVAAVCREMKFHLTAVRSRDGVNKLLGNCPVGFDLGTGFPVTGGYDFKFSGNGVLPDKEVPLVFDQNGNLFIESPPGSGIMVNVLTQQAQLTTTPTNVVPPAASFLQATQTQNRAFLNWNDISQGFSLNAALSALNAVYDLNTGILDPNGVKPVGAQWQPNTAYIVGEVVTPSPAKANGKWFRCTTPGTSGPNEPNWNAGDRATTNDSAPLVWTENTMIFSTVLPEPSSLITVGGGSAIASLDTPSSGLSASVTRSNGGAFAAGRDVYLAITLTNGTGETTPVGGLVFRNTSANDNYLVTLTSTLRAWLLALQPPAQPRNWNLYEADVATGAAAPAFSAYQLVGASANLNVGATINCLNTASGAAPPATNTALLAPSGGIVDTGARWALVLYKTRTGYISGFGVALPVQNNFEAQGQILAVNIPTGPPNVVARIVAFTVAGAPSAGPFAYISADDTLNGARVTATVINDNTTTQAVFDFNDIYLTNVQATGNNVTNYFDKIQAPPCRNVYFSETLNRMIYMPFILPSGFYISPDGDPETIFASTGLIEVAETDGENVMGWLDFKGVQYVLKEESGHEVNPSADDPSNWNATKRWEDCGPCGIRAWDKGRLFFSFIHKSGAFAHWGDMPQKISKEIPLTWARINWPAGSTFWCKIDDDVHEIRYGVALDQSTVPSHVLVCNYEEDSNLSPPIHSTIYSRGKFISSAAARKWSVHKIGAYSCFRAKRVVQNPTLNMDPETKITQLLYCSSSDSGVRAITPGVYSDDGLTIPAVYETVCPADALKVARFRALQALIGGKGPIGVEVLASATRANADSGVINNQRTEIRLKDALPVPPEPQKYICEGAGLNERFRARFSCEGKPPGTWMDLKEATIWVTPLYQAEAG